MTAGALADRFDMREGQQIVYSLNATVLQEVMARIWDLFGKDGRNRRRSP